MTRDEVVIAMQSEDIRSLRAVLRWYKRYICPLYLSNPVHLILFELVHWQCEERVMLSEWLSTQQLRLTLHSARTLNTALAIYVSAVQARPRRSGLRASVVATVSRLHEQLRDI